MNDAPHEATPFPEKLRAWLGRAVEAGASDLHLIAGYPPVLRLHGELTELAEPRLSGEETRQLVESLCPPAALARLRERTDDDFSFDVKLGDQVCRFRVNVFYAAGQLGACVRVVPTAIPEFEWAAFPRPLAERLASLRDG